MGIRWILDFCFYLYVIIFLKIITKRAIVVSSYDRYREEDFRLGESVL